jgi:TorA maturation chaperone TorD
MHLFTSLGEVVEAPGTEQARLARMLGLPGEPNRQEFTNLFVVQLFPYASIYLSPNGLAGGAVRRRAAEYWTWTGRIAPHEPDHITALLKLYGALKATLQGDYVLASVSLENRHAVFWEIIASWLPMYLLRMRELGTALYRTWSDVAFDMVEAEAAQLGAPVVMSSFLAAAPAAPQPTEPGAFIDSLFAPAVSGIILCRADLGRCAHTNRLTVRMADRRHTLKLMLTENLTGVCGWLHDEISRQADNLRRLPDALAPVRDYWVQRAEVSARGVAQLHAHYSRSGIPIKVL